MKSGSVIIVPCLLTIILCAAIGGQPAGADAGEESSARPVIRDVGALRAAVEDLTATLGAEYPRGKEFLAEIEEIESTLKSSDPGTVDAAARRFDILQRKALVGANPLINRHTWLIEVREQYWFCHSPMGTMFQNGDDNKLDCGGLKAWRGDGARLKTLRFDAAGNPTDIKTIIDVPEGVVRDPDVSFDGTKILFSMRRNKADDYHLYEMNIDGAGLKQLTFGSMLSDVDPIYLPDGRILFSSTREPKYCQYNRHIQPNLFVMGADGANITQISRNTLADFHSSLMADGRVLYSRWEYVDRHFGPSLGLWTTNPDGTRHLLYMGNNAWSPGAMLDARQIPGTDLVVCIYGSCHDLPWGALMVVDRARGMDGTKPIVDCWPKDARRYLEREDNLANNRDMRLRDRIDVFSRLGDKYEDPWPLYDMQSGMGGKYFLVSRSINGIRWGYSAPDGEVDMGIFLVDVFGNEVLLYSEPGRRESCFNPVPLCARERPPVIPPQADLTKEEGTLYVHDVYQGNGDEMASVARGAIKYLRVVEAPLKLYWREANRGIDATQVSPMNWNLTNNKRLLGDVPVEEDGSAYFVVPADRFIYFQALDKDKMMVQSMRSGTLVRPGETQGCIGCHENRLAPPPAGNKVPLAMQRPPSRIEPWYNAKTVNGSPAFNYYTEVQPVFDKSCVQCHDYGKDAGAKLNLAGDLGVTFNASYLDLMAKSGVRYDGPQKRLVSLVCDGPPGVLPAYSWGSHKSTLMETLLQEHHDVRLTREEFERIVTWIDLNGVYYGEYSSVYDARNPLSHDDFGRLLQLASFGSPEDLYNFENGHGNQISFTRPERSPILDRIENHESQEYREAFAIIEKGGVELARQPREDMTGPATKVSWQPDIDRSMRYERNVQEETESRAAVLNGSKHYQYRE